MFNQQPRTNSELKTRGHNSHPAAPIPGTHVCEGLMEGGDVRTSPDLRCADAKAAAPIFADMGMNTRIQLHHRYPCTEKVLLTRLPRFRALPVR